MTGKKASATTYPPLFPYLGGEEPGELLIVNFAGMGGSCQGLERAFRRPPDHAINHNPVALSMHRRNMPHTTHHVQDVWEVDPLALSGGRRIAAAWFSPDCTHFSKAKGGKPRKQHIRDLAWSTRKWTGLPAHLKPRVGYLENVEEFLEWGPLDEKGEPIKKRKGETFREFVAALEADGYAVEWRILKACDYGAPTTRKRLFMIFRSDGQPIRWPAPTHGDPKSQAVREGRLLPWRSAAECIEWQIPAPSIFDRRDRSGKPKPLVDNTLRRIARGLKKFVKETDEPFIAPVPAEPLGVPFMINKQFMNPSRPVTAPLSTITTNHNKNELTLAHRTKFNTGSTGSALNTPMPTVTAGGNPARPSTGNPHGLVSAHLIHFYGMKTPRDFRGQPLHEPLKTQSTENRHGLVAYSLVKHYGGTYTGAGVNLAQPLDTITSVDHHALLAASLIRIDQKGFARSGAYSVERPLNTMTTKASFCLTTGYLVKFYGTATAQGLDQPMHAITARDRLALTAATLIRQFKTSSANDIRLPLPTVMTQGGGKSLLATFALVPGLTHEQSRRARLVFDLMDRFAPEALTDRDRHFGVVLVTVRGEEYVVADVGMRMLVPRELARGQSFDDSYVLHEGADGEKITNTDQVKGLGNSVCPVMAEAVALANHVMQEAAD